ncbi:50S ribosomal protein L15 [endosymbiont GvMRE of Glomus versiforme]|uniref:50S ribosomal protein L15 n=1 Tax=endosymbiont GvMRE of Glomus versiforme TaxID=2039283 RepID=UPI000ECD7507|nr:50S ribosomal protein L15 [endosymbiont GvMRE of Glomus versiforme]RHZ37159.1 50S ribosomal protein L15 [endosymbiont GvMRE of Glomus versiforme]
MNTKEYLIKIKTKTKKSWRGSKTHGRGTKGQKARKSGRVRPGFEGGQTPIYRRVPKQGVFFHPKKEFIIVNLARLEKDQKILPKQMLDFSQSKKPVKILGTGELTKNLTIQAAAFSQVAQKKIIQADGQIKIVK